jgi:guanylate kinase
MKYKIVALMGKAGSGKDTILNKIIELDKDKKFNKIVSYTTRPPRQKEKDGEDYFFISAEEFAHKLLNDQMLEATIFKNWCYGTGYDCLMPDKINIGIFNPSGIEILEKEKDVELTIFYIKTKDKDRIIRQLNREKDPDIEEIFRRYKTDEADFIDIDEFPYVILYNIYEEDLEYCAKAIMENVV